MVIASTASARFQRGAHVAALRMIWSIGFDGRSIHHLGHSVIAPLGKSHAPKRHAACSLTQTTYCTVPLDFSCGTSSDARRSASRHANLFRPPTVRRYATDSYPRIVDREWNGLTGRRFRGHHHGPVDPLIDRVFRDARRDSVSSAPRTGSALVAVPCTAAPRTTRRIETDLLSFAPSPTKRTGLECRVAVDSHV